MNNQQLMSYKQHAHYTAGFVGLGTGIILATLFWYLLAPASMFAASLVVGGIIVAFGLILYFMPDDITLTPDNVEAGESDVDELVRDWRRGSDPQWRPDAVNERDPFVVR